MEENLSILEKGEIYFFYKPKVEKGTDKEKVHSLEDTQRFFFILSPLQKRKYRLILVGKKKLPPLGNNHPYFCLIEKVFSTLSSFKKTFHETTYSTLTKGARTQEPPRIVGQGNYALFEHNRHTHLYYQLEKTSPQGKVQKDLHITPEGNYILTLKNPRSKQKMTSSPVTLPLSLQKAIGDRQFVSAKPLALLDYEGMELLLIGEKLLSQQDLKIVTKELQSIPSLSLLKKLGLEQKSQDPLKKGTWT